MSYGLRQSLALRARALPGVKWFYSFWYRLSQAVVRFSVSGLPGAKGLYLRRGGGRGELVPGASDLDFFIVLETLSAEQEMHFLQRFWARYRKLKRVFPFLGEVLMGDENELRNWSVLPLVRSYESSYSWRLLWGRDLLPEQKSPPPSARDVFTEALRHYGDLLQPTLKISNFSQELRPWSWSSIQIRHGAKAALDLFRLHSALTTSDPRKIWAATREELADFLPIERYGSEPRELIKILQLKAPLFSREPLDLFTGLIFTALGCLEEIASFARAEQEETFHLALPSSGAPQDPYSLSVRELFAERILQRHNLKRAVLSEQTAHMYLLLPNLPSRDSLRAMLEDLRDVSFSFERFSFAMPLTETIFSELERTSFFDLPFHSFLGHREISLIGPAKKCDFQVGLPASVLKKSFAELSFALRLEPTDFSDFLERMVTLVLSLRLVSTHREVSSGFFETLTKFSTRYPSRERQLRERIAPFLASPAEEKIWKLIFHDVEFGGADHLKNQLIALRDQNRQQRASPSLASDAWINLTPFLRMEMNAMKDHFFQERPPLRI